MQDLCPLILFVIYMYVLSEEKCRLKNCRVLCERNTERTYRESSRESLSVELS